jgi:hypothetical protein
MADQDLRTSIRDGNATAHVTKRFVELATGVYAEVVAIGATETDVILTGDVVVDTLGALNNAKVVDPDAASATIPALLRGILAQQVAILAAIGAAGDAAGANTVIGQLKQIAENTTPA